jgi:hypothetical protein
VHRDPGIDAEQVARAILALLTAGLKAGGIEPIPIMPPEALLKIVDPIPRWRGRPLGVLQGASYLDLRGPVETPPCATDEPDSSITLSSFLSAAIFCPRQALWRTVEMGTIGTRAIGWRPVFGSSGIVCHFLAARWAPSDRLCDLLLRTNAGWLQG